MSTLHWYHLPVESIKLPEDFVRMVHKKHQTTESPRDPAHKTTGDPAGCRERIRWASLNYTLWLPGRCVCRNVPEWGSHATARPRSWNLCSDWQLWATSAELDAVSARGHFCVKAAASPRGPLPAAKSWAALFSVTHVCPTARRSTSSCPCHASHACLGGAASL